MQMRLEPPERQFRRAAICRGWQPRSPGKSPKINARTSLRTLRPQPSTGPLSFRRAPGLAALPPRSSLVPSPDSSPRSAPHGSRRTKPSERCSSRPVAGLVELETDDGPLIQNCPVAPKLQGRVEVWVGRQVVFLHVLHRYPQPAVNRPLRFPKVGSSVSSPVEQSPQSLTAAFARWSRCENTFSGSLAEPRSSRTFPVSLA